MGLKILGKENCVQFGHSYLSPVLFVAEIATEGLKILKSPGIF